MTTPLSYRSALLAPGSMHSKRSSHRTRMLALVHSLYRQNTHFLQRVVGQFTSISFHVKLEKFKATKFQKLSAQLLTYE
jgi:hypothetical protein